MSHHADLVAPSSLRPAHRPTRGILECRTATGGGGWGKVCGGGCVVRVRGGVGWWWWGGGTRRLRRRNNTVIVAWLRPASSRQPVSHATVALPRG